MAATIRASRRASALDKGRDFQGSAAVAARCRALVAGDDELDARFARALELHGAAWPFARARTELCYGERLRRAGRRIDARVQLHAALETFERLGARPWAERAAGELRASGERIRRSDPTAAEQLTPRSCRSRSPSRAARPTARLARRCS
jgi:hypothetical protein